MKLVIPFVAVVLLASSCSTAYKAGQTPDDVYYSEPKPVVARGSNSGDDYVQMDRQNSRQYRNNRQQSEQYNDAYGYYDDRYLRMKVRNRRMWSGLDYYYSDPLAYRYYDPFWAGAGLWGANSYWNPYMAWGYHYNPYYYGNSHVIIVNPQSPVYSRPRTTNLNMFNTTNTPVYTSPKTNNNYRSNNRTYSQPSNFGNDIRRTFSNNNNNSTSQPSRSTINNGSSGSSSSGSTPSRSSGSSAPVRRF